MTTLHIGRPPQLQESYGIQMRLQLEGAEQLAVEA